MAPGDGPVAGGPGQHKLFVAIKDRQKLERGIRGHRLGMIDRALHGLCQRRETRENQWGGPARHMIRRRPVR